MKSDRKSDFSDRFLALSVRNGWAVSKACREIGIARSLYYEIRDGIREPSLKVWDKLEAAERDAAVEHGTAPIEAEESVSKSISEMSLADLLDRLPPSAKPAAARIALSAMETMLLAHLTSAEGLAYAVIAQRSGEDDPDEVEELLANAPKRIIDGTGAAKEIVLQFVAALSGENDYDPPGKL